MYSDVPFYREVTNASQEQHWYRLQERESAAELIRTWPRASLPMLRLKAEKALLPGEAPLVDVQIVTYLSQLISCNSTLPSPIA